MGEMMDDEEDFVNAFSKKELKGIKWVLEEIKVRKQAGPRDPYWEEAIAENWEYYYNIFFKEELKKEL